MRQVTHKGQRPLPVTQRFVAAGEPGPFGCTRMPAGSQEGITGFFPVVRKQGSALVKLRRIAGFHNAGDGGVGLTAAILEQTAQGDFVRQRMAEGIFGDRVE